MNVGDDNHQKMYDMTPPDCPSGDIMRLTSSRAKRRYLFSCCLSWFQTVITASSIQAASNSSHHNGDKPADRMGIWSVKEYGVPLELWFWY
ncbi:hypothetical protein BDW62DRAFT_179979 [Aspergillus aurantiobrunneus]